MYAFELGILVGCGRVERVCKMCSEVDEVGWNGEAACFPL